MTHYIPDYFSTKKKKTTVTPDLEFDYRSPVHITLIGATAATHRAHRKSARNNKPESETSFLHHFPMRPRHNTWRGSMESTATTDSMKQAFWDLVSDSAVLPESPQFPEIKDDNKSVAAELDVFPLHLEALDDLDQDLDDPLDDGGISYAPPEEALLAPPVPKVFAAKKEGKTCVRKRLHVKHDVAPEMRVYSTPTEQDVCLGRGGWTNAHPGNRQFHAWKNMLKDEYFSIPKKLERTPVAEKLLHLVHQHGGRFMAKDNTKNWYEIDVKKAREKCSQVLRDSKITAEDRFLKRLKYPKKKAEP